MYVVTFHPNGKHVLGGNEDGIRRWQLADGQEVGKQAGMELQAIAVSRDDKWVVCGTRKGASVWDGDMHERVIDMEGTSKVWAVDTSPDATRFATGTNKDASIWTLTRGERLVGPLEHENLVNGIRFSSNGDHIATACLGNSIHIFDSQTGDELITINTDIPGWGAVTPLAWSSDTQQIFAASHDNKIRSFNTFTGSQLAESQILHGSDYNVHCITLAANGKFIATFAKHSISFLDTSTLTRVGPVIEDSEQIRSITISADSNHLVTGQTNGKIIIRALSKILPDSWSIPCKYLCLYNLGMSNNPHSVAYGDKLHRNLLASKCVQTSNLLHRAVTITRHPTLVQ